MATMGHPLLPFGFKFPFQNKSIFIKQTENSINTINEKQGTS